MNRERRYVTLVVDRKAALLLSAVLVVVGMAGILSSQQLSMTATYPIPAGVYNQIVTTGNSGGTPADTTLNRGAGNTILVPPTNAGGNVGIGTASPDSKLVVAGIAAVGKLQINEVSTEGAACSPNGLVSRTSGGLLLSCQALSWRSMASGKTLAEIKALRANSSASCSMVSTVSAYPNIPATPHWYSFSGEIRYNAAGEPSVRVSGTGGYWNQTCPNSCDTGWRDGPVGGCSVANGCDGRGIAFKLINDIYGSIVLSTSGADVDAEIKCGQDPEFTPIFSLVP